MTTGNGGTGTGSGTLSGTGGTGMTIYTFAAKIILNIIYIILQLT